jgi:translation initiation factor eIF-2B subunit gamma
MVVLDPPRRDPFAAALARSTTRPFSESTVESSTSTPSSADRTPFPATLPSSPQSQSDQLFPAGIETSRKRRRSNWKCQYILADKSTVKVKAEGEHLIRANSLAGYWELNRRFLKSLTANGPATRIVAPSEDNAQLISPSAQISPDSIIGESTRLGERASIKKSVVGRHCNIGRGAKITGCILWDFVTVEEK